MTDTATTATLETRAAFDPLEAYRMSPRVGLRPEPFGALAYHYDTRRLVFLKSTALVDLVRVLEHHPTAAAAIAASPAPPNQRAAFVAALASLCDSGVVEPREQDVA